MRELKDYVPVILMDKEELNKQLTEMQKCTPAEAIVPVLTGAASGFVYAAAYEAYRRKAVLNAYAADSNIIALEGALTGVGIHMAKQVLFRALYGNNEKAEAMNSLDTMATLAAFLGLSRLLK